MKWLWAAPRHPQPRRRLSLGDRSTHTSPVTVSAGPLVVNSFGWISTVGSPVNGRSRDLRGPRVDLGDLFARQRHVGCLDVFGDPFGP
jgi:hypothetical protein